MDLEQTFKEGSAAFEADDYATAAAKILPLANDGHAASQYVLAEMYRWGNGIEQNAEQALHFYKSAADQGHPRAAWEMSFLLRPRGKAAPKAMETIEKDAAAAERYLDLAVTRFKNLAEDGDIQAMTFTGFLFHHGFGVEPDPTEAIRWYVKSFDAGGFGTANNLALLYYEGDVGVRDKTKASTGT